MSDYIEGGPDLVVPGSKPYQCAFCQTRVYLAPSSQPRIASGEGKPCCGSCAQDLISRGANYGVAPESFQELDHWRKRN